MNSAKRLISPYNISKPPGLNSNRWYIYAGVNKRHTFDNISQFNDWHIESFIHWFATWGGSIIKPSLAPSITLSTSEQLQSCMWSFTIVYMKTYDLCDFFFSPLWELTSLAFFLAHLISLACKYLSYNDSISIPSTDHRWLDDVPVGNVSNAQLLKPFIDVLSTSTTWNRERYPFWISFTESPPMVSSKLWHYFYRCERGMKMLQQSLKYKYGLNGEHPFLI